MNMMQATRKQKGFTIIELVVVILLLGILAATALPRFMDVTDEAHTSVIDATQGGLQTGVALYHAQWVGQGQPASGEAVNNFPIPNLDGYPGGSDTDGVLDTTNGETDCVSIYEGLLQGGAPSIAEGETWDPAATLALVATGDPSADFYVFHETAAADPNAPFAGADEVCIYLYSAQASNLERSLVYVPGTEQIYRYDARQALDDDINGL